MLRSWSGPLIRLWSPRFANMRMRVQGHPTSDPPAIPKHRLRAPSELPTGHCQKSGFRYVVTAPDHGSLGLFVFEPFDDLFPGCNRVGHIECPVIVSTVTGSHIVHAPVPITEWTMVRIVRDAERGTRKAVGPARSAKATSSTIAQGKMEQFGHALSRGSSASRTTGRPEVTRLRFSTRPPAEPGVSIRAPLKAAVGVARAAPLVGAT